MACILTIGGSIGGLAAALVLSGRGHEVTVLERDPDPTPSGPEVAWSSWPRRGVAHLRGTHVFGARGLQILRDNLPEVLDELKAAGAREVPIPGSATDGGGDLSRLACRRTTYEMTLRVAALLRPSICFRSNTAVEELVPGPRANSGIPHVAGVRSRGGRTLAADLVVDTSGRHSPVAKWLRTLGAEPTPARSRDSGMAVNTRWYRLRDGSAEPALVQVDLGYGGWVLSPADDGMFSVTFGVFGDDPTLRRLRRPDVFQAAASAVTAIAPWVAPDVSIPDGGIRYLGHLPNRLRRLSHGGRRPAASGVVALGDAAVCTNPRFGRGVSLALVQAVGLADVIDAHDHPVEQAAAFAAFTRFELEPWFHDAVARDAVSATIAERVRSGVPLMSIGSDDHDPELRFARATPYAVQHDPVVRRAFHRTWHLVDPPATFGGDPAIRARVDAVWREIRSYPPSPGGPGYMTMLGILAGH